MNKNLLKTGVEVFIQNNLKTDIVSVLLKKSPFTEISPQELAQQLQGKQISQKKFPTLFNNPGIIYPKKVHLEQASSEKTAAYKATLVSGKSLLDLTAGMGIDSYHFASRFEDVMCCEKNEELSRITAHNLVQLEAHNVTVVPKDGVAFLESTSKRFDCIYLDPSRRMDGSKVVLLEESEPNMYEIQQELFAKSDSILLKTSPLLDIEEGQRKLLGVVTCYVVAVDNEVKELIWLMNKNYSEEPLRKAINIAHSDIREFSFTASDETDLQPSISDPMRFLYEPFAAILKAGGFKSVGYRFHVHKLASNSHLYTSEERTDFPGRVFKIEGVEHFSRHWNANWEVHKANITIRNFPMTVAELRKRFKIEDGGHEYLFFTTLSQGEKVVIRCVKC